MRKAYLSWKIFGLIRGSILFCLLLIIIIALFADYHLSRTTAFDRLDVVAEITTESIREPLQRGQIEVVKNSLKDLSRKYHISSIELYGVDGSLIAAIGANKDKVSEPLILKKHDSSGWPISPLFQYAQFVLSGKKPLGILVIRSKGNGNVYRWVSCSLVILAGVVALLLYVMFGRLNPNRDAVPWFINEERKESFEHQGSSEEEGEPSSKIELGRRVQNGKLEKLVQQKIDKLTEERDLALASARAKSDFLANMSHEIRTPMNGVIGVISLLQRSGLPAETKRLLDAAARSADTLLLIISDILDFSKIEAGKIDFENISFDLREIVEESVALYTETAGVKDIELLCYMPLTIPTRVFGDPTRLRQVITNLVNNAVKFTEEGEVSLQVELVEAKDTTQLLRFTIEDTGIGIAQEKLEGLFEMFSQANRSTTRKYGGSGLGLSVCKKLIELQNGELGVQSRLGRGTSFWFTMEYQVDGESTQILPCESIEGKKVVTIDKSETSRTILHQYLKGCQIESRVSSGDGEIIDQLREIQSGGFNPDIVMIDYSFLSGTAFTFRELLVDIFGKDIPDYFVFTKKSGLTKRLVKQGASGVIQKPVRLLQLYEELSGQSMISFDDDESSSADEMLHGTVLLVDDEPINQKVGEAILEKIGLTVEVVSSGKLAIERTKSKKYDLVLLDIQMPEMSGFEAAELIRKREHETGSTRQIIIAVTANTLESTKDRCLAVGMDDFIGKPIKPDVLTDHLRPWLSGTIDADLSFTSNPTDDESTVEKVTEQGFSEIIWDRQLALDYVGGDTALLLDLMTLFLKRKEGLLASVESAIEKGDANAINDTIHAFKGAVNHFAAQRARELAQTIEDNSKDGNIDGIDALMEELYKAVNALEIELNQEIEGGL